LLLRTVILTTSPTVLGITLKSTQSCRTPSRSAAQTRSWWRARPRRGQKRPDVLNADATSQQQCGPPSTVSRRTSFREDSYSLYRLSDHCCSQRLFVLRRIRAYLSGGQLLGQLLGGDCKNASLTPGSTANAMTDTETRKLALDAGVHLKPQFRVLEIGLSF
jgi:hypothetical protein